jgi:hypothetical protein
MKSLNQNMQSWGRDVNPGHPENEASANHLAGTLIPACCVTSVQFRQKQLVFFHFKYLICGISYGHDDIQEQFYKFKSTCGNH